ncbi:putative ribonuclease H [Rhexocercosporidium sp. MPI-PUGE-AT-0058]|nr:putative ribonuclease H [Rhexocercosporidium sp. MPI-PUGE-AT-0058]
MSSSAGSKKRKLGEDVQKFYAVRAGRVPGVYMTWKECQDHTTGFGGAVYKSFLTKKEADDFVAGKSKSKPGEEKFYAVAVGHIPGVYTEWPDAQMQIHGAKDPKYKKFETRKEAEEFVRSGAKGAKKGEAVNGAKEKRGKKVPEGEEDEPSAKRSRTGASSETKGKWLRIYTDGSALGNGRMGAVAGVGVFFGVGDKRNVSESLEGELQTNNRAELTGVLRALEIAPKKTNVEIITDSNYSINCVSVWYKAWVKKNWMTSGGKIVENQDLIKGVRALIEERDAVGAETKFTWIKGHNEDPGNTAADRLAVAGAQSSR